MSSSLSWPLHLTPDSNGGLSWPSSEDSVAQRLQVILATQPGELRWRPRFGAGLSSFVGAPDTPLTRQRVADAVQGAVSRWEPGLHLYAVEVGDGPRPGTLRVVLRYALPEGPPRQLGLTLSLVEG